MSRALTISQHWISSPQGKLFAQCWQPTASIHEPNTPIVMLHDSLGCVGLWRDFPALLASQTGRAVIAYDRLGFGRSDARHDQLPADFIAEEAALYFPLVQNHFGFAHCIVLGHSVGGGMAVHCAARYPGVCVALITESAQAFVEDKTRAGIEQARAQFNDQSAMERLARYHDEKASWVLDAWTETWLAPGFAGWSLASVLPQVKCPTLVIHGAEDEYGSNLHPRLIADSVDARAELVIMSATHHVPHREHGLSVAITIDNFIQRY